MMNPALAKYLWHTLRASSLLFALFLTMAILLWSDPLTSAIVIEGRGPLGVSCVIMLLSGLVTAAILFHESPGVGVWLNSRGQTRSETLFTRCVVGLSVLTVLTGLCGLLIALGIRQFVQQQMGSPYFPMIRWYELRILPDLFASACLPFLVAVAFIHITRSRSVSGGWYAVALVSSGISAVILLLCAPAHRLIVMLFFWLVPALCLLLASMLAPHNELPG